MIYFNYKTSLESDTVTESKQAEADVHPENLFKIHIPLLLSNSLKEKLTQNQKEGVKIYAESIFYPIFG
jgi:hypothetical protein